MGDIKNKVEAILFAAGRSVKLSEIASLLELKDNGLINEAIKDIKEECIARNSPILLIEEGEGWKLTVQEKYLPTVRRINPHTELSRAVMETLAVVAWKAPILQSDVIKIRTNKAYEHVSELENLGFLTKERQGRSFILKPTQKFMDYFDLPDNQSVKNVFDEFKDIEIIPQKTVGDFSEDSNKEGEEEKKSGEVPEDNSELPESESAESNIKDQSHLGPLSVFEQTDTPIKEVKIKESFGDLEVFEESELESPETPSQLDSSKPESLSSSDEESLDEESLDERSLDERSSEEPAPSEVSNKENKEESDSTQSIDLKSDDEQNNIAKDIDDGDSEDNNKDDGDDTPVDKTEDNAEENNKNSDKDKDTLESQDKDNPDNPDNKDDKDNKDDNDDNDNAGDDAPKPAENSKKDLADELLK